MYRFLAVIMFLEIQIFIIGVPVNKGLFIIYTRSVLINNNIVNSISHT